MARLSTREAIAKAFAPYSKEYQRRAAEAEKRKSETKKPKYRIMDEENSRFRTNKFVRTIKNKNLK